MYDINRELKAVYWYVKFWAAYLAFYFSIPATPLLLHRITKRIRKKLHLCKCVE